MRHLLVLALSAVIGHAAFAAPPTADAPAQSTLVVAPADAAALTPAITAAIGCPAAGCATAQPIEALRKTHPNLAANRTAKGFEPLMLGPRTALRFTDARLVDHANGGPPALALTLDPASATVFAELTTRHVDHKVAILIGDRVVSAPVVREPIKGGRLHITTANPADAKALLAVLQPAKAAPAAVKSAGPTP